VNLSRPGMNSRSATSSSLKRAPQQRASARLACVRPGIPSPAKLASRRSLCLRLMPHLVTVQPLTKIGTDSRATAKSIKFAPYPLPLAPMEGKETFFCGVVQAGYPPAKPPYFSPGRGRGNLKLRIAKAHQLRPGYLSQTEQLRMEIITELGTMSSAARSWSLIRADAAKQSKQVKCVRDDLASCSLRALRPRRFKWGQGAGLLRVSFELKMLK